MKKFEHLINTRLVIEKGSMMNTSIWNKEKLLEEITSVIKHNLYDADFHYNWTKLNSEYYSIFNNETLVPMLKNIDKTLLDFFVIKNGLMGEVLEFKLQGKEAQKWIDKWFKKNKAISIKLKNDYCEYRKKYADVDI